MFSLWIHLVVFVAVNGLLFGVWTLTGGDASGFAADPASALDGDVWPIWVLLPWLAAVVIHAGFVVGGVLRPRRRRRRAERARNRLEASLARDRAGRRRPPTRAEPSAPPKGPEAPPPPEPGAAPARASGRRWVCVLFSDIVASTEHAERLGDERWSKVISRYRDLVRSAVAERNGRPVGTQGDGVLVRFDSPADAVLCGVDIQKRAAELRDKATFFPELRVGVHAGEAIEDEGDLIGTVINLASRVTAEAQPGEILVTEPVADQLTGRLAIEDRGLRALRGLAQPRHLLAVVWDE